MNSPKGLLVLQELSHVQKARLGALRRERELCAELCPHWDYSSVGNHPCCDALADAERALKAYRAKLSV